MFFIAKRKAATPIFHFVRTGSHPLLNISFLRGVLMLLKSICYLVFDSISTTVIIPYPDRQTAASYIYSQFY